MRIIREDKKTGVAVVEVGGRFYVVQIRHDRGQVYSVMASDMPLSGGKWYGAMTDAGVDYVAHARTRAAAMEGYRRCVREMTGDKRAFEIRREDDAEDLGGGI